MIIQFFVPKEHKFIRAGWREEILIILENEIQFRLAEEDRLDVLESTSKAGYIIIFFKKEERLRAEQVAKSAFIRNLKGLSVIQSEVK
jgi:hypothetical protein